mgnify:CR=1 FL=1
MPIAYKIANIVCSCSTEPESFGRVAVEAQSMGVPIIASDIGGSKETIVKVRKWKGYFTQRVRQIA